MSDLDNANRLAKVRSNISLYGNGPMPLIIAALVCHMLGASLPGNVANVNPKTPYTMLCCKCSADAAAASKQFDSDMRNMTVRKMRLK